jgi:guanylate kinase
VVNEIFANALRDLQAIVAASRLRASPMMARYPALVKRLGA